MTTTAFDLLKAALADRYAIARELGRGGMGTVYLAHDLKHNRQVALKVLLPELAAVLGVRRFLNEINVVAHLQHPHILPLFDSGEAEGVVYFVMPYNEGESLRDRLHREIQLPLDEALQITKEVASALFYAHRQGVIHRDIKPANILLHDGQALVADFGIALAVSAAGGDRLTWTGVSLGTPDYMSPEQASGDRNLDARSDTYSLASVLYEMLAGQPPHSGASSQAILARILTEEPVPVSHLRGIVPRHVEAAVHKALAKLPADRFLTVADFSRALAEPTTPRTLELPPVEAPQHRPSSRRGWRRATIITWLAAAAAVAVAIWGARQLRAPTRVPIRRWEILMPDSAPMAFVGAAPNAIGRPAIAVAPDGDRLVYVAKRGNTTQLYQRELDKLEATPLAGTEGANEPFFSPDGAWVAFYAGTDLKKVSVAGGQVVTLARVNDAYGGVWLPDGRILAAADEGCQAGWVPASGGPLQRIPTAHVCWQFPQVLPGGDWVLHGGFDGALYLTSLDSKKAFAITSEGLRPRDSADVSKLVYGSHPLYAATGHILYLSGGDGILMALPFDPGRQRVLGPPVPILGGIRQEAETGVGQLSMADDGTLVYAPGVNAGLSVPVWVEAGGHVDTLPFPRTHYGSFDLSRDGKQLLIRTIPASGKAELRVFDLERGSQTLIATRGIPSFYPRWLADATEVAFGEFTPEGGNVAPLLRQTPTAAAPETLSTAAETYEPSPDGRYLLVVHWRNAPGVWLLPLSGGSEQPVQLLPNDVTFPAFSPDGRWLAYTDRGQPPNIHVISLDRPEIPHRVSLAGGEEGLWSPQGDQIIYRNRQKWFAVDVSIRPKFQVGRPRLLFEGAYLNVAGWSHDISPDGRRHLFLLGSPEETTTHLVVVQNWFSELQRLAPPGRK